MGLDACHLQATCTYQHFVRQPCNQTVIINLHAGERDTFSMKCLAQNRPQRQSSPGLQL